MKKLLFHTLTFAGTFLILASRLYSQEQQKTEERWVDLLKTDSPVKFSMFERARIDDGVLTMTSPQARVRLPAGTNVSDGAIRVRTKYDPAVDSLSAIARDWYSVFITGSPASIKLKHLGGRFPAKLLNSFSPPKPLQAGDEYELELRAVGNTLTVLFNGQILGTIQDQTVASGKFGISLWPKSAPAKVTRLEWLDLSHSTTATPAPAPDPNIESTTQPATKP